MTIDSHLLADIQERLHKDGVSIAFLRDRGIKKDEAADLLRQLGAVRNKNTNQWHVPSVARKANSNIRFKGRR